MPILSHSRYSSAVRLITTLFVTVIYAGNGIFNYDEFTALIKGNEILEEFERIAFKDEVNALPTNTRIVLFVAALIACLETLDQIKCDKLKKRYKSDERLNKQ